MHVPDKELENRVAGKLNWDRSILPSRIIVRAHNGSVTLSGVVGTRKECAQAEADARAVWGVHDVDNQLAVSRSGDSSADEKLAADCTAALNGSRKVPAGAVSVQAFDGWITASGRVRNSFERIAVRRTLSNVPGVRGVTDELRTSAGPDASKPAEGATKDQP